MELTMPHAHDRTVTGAPDIPVPHPTRTGRRAFLEQMTGAAAVLAVTPALANMPRLPMAEASSPLAPPSRRDRREPGPWSDAWLDKLTGKHKQFFDTLDPDDGFGLAFTMHFLNLNHEAYGLADGQLTAVVGLRHFAMPMALPDALWDRYQIGDFDHRGSGNEAGGSGNSAGDAEEAAVRGC